MTMDEDLSLPRILCLHGGGTSSRIFRVQASRLKILLRSDFRFVFVDGPFERSAGPGVLPVFEGLEPYLGWVPADAWQTDEHKLKVTEVLKRAMRADEGTAPFVGIMGFSQGARLAAGCLMEEERRRLAKEGTKLANFRFGVLMGATHSPMLLEPGSPSYGGPAGLDCMDLSQTKYFASIKVPTIHVVGTRDPVCKGKKVLLNEYCDARHAKLFEFDGGHHLPRQNDAASLAELILKAYRYQGATGHWWMADEQEDVSV
ncbi:MAG: hypothetical protein M1837_000749 [Sclerophora amabilis]|nr:MAG: hypothetical protein M1837_000749 [Sclerophora amabilis]